MIYIEFLASLAECLIVVRFCNKFLEFKNAKNHLIKSTAFFLILFIDNILLSQKSGFENLSIVILLAVVFIYSILFLKGKIYEKLLVTFIPTITTLPISLITVHAFSLWGDVSVTNNFNHRFMILFFSKFAFFIVCEVIIKLKKHKSYSLTSFQWLMQLSCFVISFLIANTLWKISIEDFDNRLAYLFIYILLAFLNVILYTLLNIFQKDNNIKSEYKAAQAELNSQKQLFPKIQDQYKEIKTLKHDMKHCLTTAAELISNNEAEKAYSYIENVLNERIDTALSTTFTGNAVIDAVLSDKQQSCNKKSIEMKMIIDTELAEISTVDLSILLSNMLDNAINGCTNSASPKIELSIKKKKAYVVIVVRNSISYSILSENPELKTSNPDKEYHGYGIQSIKNIAKQYGGVAEFYEDNGFFITEVTLKTVN